MNKTCWGQAATRRAQSKLSHWEKMFPHVRMCKQRVFRRKTRMCQHPVVSKNKRQMAIVYNKASSQIHNMYAYKPQKHFSTSYIIVFRYLFIFILCICVVLLHDAYTSQTHSAHAGLKWKTDQLIQELQSYELPCTCWELSQSPLLR